MERTAKNPGSQLAVRAAAVVELSKPVTWFPPMWAFMCGVVSSGQLNLANLPLLLAGIVLAGPLLASARRWQRGGILRTVLLMWRLRLAYFLGASPQRLAAKYRLCSSPTRES